MQDCRVPGYPALSSTKILSTWNICRWLRENLTRGYTHACLIEAKSSLIPFHFLYLFETPLKFDQKVPHVFWYLMLIIQDSKTICFSVTYNMVLMLINLLSSSLVLTCWVHTMQGAFLSDPQPSWLFGNHWSDWQKFAGHVLYAIGGRFNKPKNYGFPSVYQRLSFYDASFVVSDFKGSGL